MGVGGFWTMLSPHEANKKKVEAGRSKLLERAIQKRLLDVQNESLGHSRERD